MSTNLRRILTAIAAAPVVLGLAYLGGWPFAALIAIIGMIGQRELYQMARRVGAVPLEVVGMLLGALVVATVLWPRLWVLPATLFLLFVAGAPLLLPQEHFLSSFTVTIAGSLYPTGLLGSLVWLREARGPTVDDGAAFHLVLLTILLVWATDVFAYYVGRWMGAHPLAPTTSPNKTWEGTLGGLGAAVVVGVVLKLVLVDVLTWPHLVVLIVLAGGVGQLGDLLESQLKRSTATDDSSHLLPGHGGMLDRFDAMAVAAPFITLYLYVVVGLFG